MDVERIDRLISCLETFQGNASAVYEKAIAPIGVAAYFLGFGFALRIALGIESDIRREWELRKKAAELCGWNVTEPPLDQMKQRGMTPSQVLSELAAIEIAFIRLVITQAEK